MSCLQSIVCLLMFIFLMTLPLVDSFVLEVLSSFPLTLCFCFSLSFCFNSMVIIREIEFDERGVAKPQPNHFSYFKMCYSLAK